MQSKKLPTIISKAALNKWLLMNELSVADEKFVLIYSHFLLIL